MKVMIIGSRAGRGGVSPPANPGGAYEIRPISTFGPGNIAT
jgi:hypothetical protein